MKPRNPTALRPEALEVPKPQNVPSFRSKSPVACQGRYFCGHVLPGSDFGDRCAALSSELRLNVVYLHNIGVGIIANNFPLYYNNPQKPYSNSSGPISFCVLLPASQCPAPQPASRALPQAFPAKGFSCSPIVSREMTHAKASRFASIPGYYSAGGTKSADCWFKSGFGCY